MKLRAAVGTLRVRARKAILYTLLPIAVCVWVNGLAGGCASALPPDPTPERPRLGCIADSPFASRQVHKHTGNRLLPEVVRVIGVTSGEDGERWMVIRGIYSPAMCLGELIDDQESCPWLPFDRGSIQFGVACGREAEAFREMQRGDE